MQRRLIPTWLVFFCSWLSFMGLCFLNASAQNYIISRTYKDGQAADAGNVAKTTTQVQYMDGLGRPIQQVAVGQSPTGKDIIVHQAYDAYGREPKQFLPFTDAGSAGSFRSNASSLQNTFYGSNTLQFSPADNTRPYNETTFESSPLNRPLEQQAPGQSSYSYLAYGVNNNANTLTTVKRYDFQEHTNLENTVVANGNYINGQLWFVKVTDENGKIAIEFKDKLGQVILKRAVVEGSTFADTYYVYDDLGQLRAVLQPMYQNESSTHKFAFLYRYDDRGRLTEKQVPGAESVEMRYDQYDRLVLSRDGNQRVRDTWSFTKYDALNRPIVTGEINNSAAPTPLQLLSNGHHETLTGAGEVKYSLTATLPSLSDESGVLNVTYYDNYTNWGALAYADQYSLTPHTALKGQTTGARSRMLNPDGSYGDFLISTIYYDDNYRPIQTIKQLFGFLGENDPVLRLSIQYKYAVATVIAKEREQQGTSSSVVSIEKEYGYDHADRLLWVKHQITRDGIAQPQVTLAATDYNELGQLNQKWLHSTDGAKFRRQTAYTYSIRGWQTAGHTVLKKQDQISAQTQFKYLLAYGQGGGTYTNGNISDMSWEDYDDTHNGSYSFSYDGLNRLMSTGSAGGTNEGGLGYDLNGNLNTLKRWQNGTLIDDLTYHYSQGNRLNGIVDHSSHVAGFKEASTGGMGSYAYDANGNLTQDLNKGIAVGNLQYNLLNLVRQITIDSSTLAYYYDASGQKHQLVYSNTADVTKSESTRYAGSVEWEGNHLKRIATGEGQYIYKTSSTGEYQYYLNDHLGNTRIVVTDSGKVLQRTDYYAFGLQIPLLPITSDSLRLVNKYLYNGKELQPQTGLLDYGARQYDAAVGRWFGVDVHAENYYSLSGYSYAASNPILYIDPDGRDIGFSQAGQTTDKKTGVTTTTYNVNISIAVMNSSSMSSKEYQKVVSSFISQLTKALSGTFNAGDKSKLVFQAGNIDVRSVSSMSDVKTTDHLMVVVDDVTGKDAKGGEAGGLAEIGGKIAYVEKGDASFTAGNMIHEFGHNMGLVHNWDSGYKDDDGATNYMGYGKVKNQLAGVQLFQTLNKYNANPMQINKGQNYETLTNDYIISGYTTQQMPINYNVNRGGKIPRRLKN